MQSLQSKKVSDLQKELAEKRKALYDFRFGVAGSKIKNVKEARGLRKDIARILTELNRQRHLS